MQINAFVNGDRGDIKTVSQYKKCNSIEKQIIKMFNTK